MFRFAILAFLFVTSIDNIGPLRDWRSIAWLVVAIVLGLAMFFEFVPFPFTVQRKAP